MDQQVAIGLGPRQGLEDAVNFGIDGMAHVGSLDRRNRGDKDVKRFQMQINAKVSKAEALDSN